jgi:RNA polymerase sigma-70 factor (ECF subfamily)
MMAMKSRSRRRTADRAEFESLYERYSREVWAIVYGRWLHSETALDIMQETFLRYWRKRQSGEVILNPRAWLLRVARNLAEDHAKSSFQRNGTQSPQVMNGVCSRASMPLEVLETKETFAQIRGALSKLAVSDREILTLRYALDYETDRIAEILEASTAAVHMRLSRARQRLGELLEVEGVTHIP